MDAEKVKRKLAAILSADVKGYSRLMGIDEVGTIRLLETYRRVMSDHIQKKGGRVVDSPGDNLLAEFASVVDALESAVEIQRELKVRNADRSESRRMEFRIGINLGDVVEEGERIYGDGVNIAARIEGLAEAGGICISRTVFDQVRNKLKLGYEYLGEHAVKNIADPVRVYRVLMEPDAAGKVIGEAKPRKGARRYPAVAGLVAIIVIAGGIAFFWHFQLRPPPIEPARMDRMAFPLPDSPSVAVLPFANMSEDPKQEYLADGITENIISALSQVPKLFVIARNSTFTYKGKPVKVQQVAEELGVRYVLEGSVQKGGDALRITAQLIDAITGHHIWSERYDRELKNIFALQDDITIKVITALRVKLTEGEQARLLTRGTENLQAYLKYLQAQEVFFTVTREGNAQARRLLEEVVALDQNYPPAYGLLASICFMDASLGISKSPRESLKQAFELIKRGIALDDASANSHSLLGWLYVPTERQYDKAIAECERAVALAPNSANCNTWLGTVLMYSGRHEEAIRYLERALRLDPIPQGWGIRNLGSAYFHAGRHEEAIATLKRSLHCAPDDLLTHLALTSAYSWAGRHGEAHAQAAEVLRINPNFSVEERAKFIQYRNQADLDQYLEGLRKAGLPDKPPLPLPDKPSITVLPFTNMSDDPKQEFFADGLAEEIINALSKLPQLFVIARNSSFKYKGKAVDVRQVGRDLGVRYVLEGSVRRDGERVRVTAQLIEASTGNHLFSERYDRELKEIFATQDEIAIAIVRALRVTVTSGEQARLTGKKTKNLDAYLKAIQAGEQFYLMNRQGSARAKDLAREAIGLDPGYAYPYAVLANAHMLDVWFRFSESPEESMKLADGAAHKALELDDRDPYIHSTLTNLHVMQRQYERAIASAECALALAPGAARSQSSMGTALAFSCRFDEAIPFFEEAVRLNPYPPGALFRSLGSAYSAIGRHEQALKAYQKALKLNPDDIFAHLSLAAHYVEMGREEQARAEAREVLRLHPRFSLEHFAETLTYKDQAVVDRRIDLLRRAGLK